MDEGIGDSLRDYLASVGGQKTPSLVYKKTDKYFFVLSYYRSQKGSRMLWWSLFYGSQKRARRWLFVFPFGISKIDSVNNEKTHTVLHHRQFLFSNFPQQMNVASKLLIPPFQCLGTYHSSLFFYSRSHSTLMHFLREMWTRYFQTPKTRGEKKKQWQSPLSVGYSTVQPWL